MGRKELGQKPQADAPAKEQSPGHLSLLQTNTQQQVRQEAAGPCMGTMLRGTSRGCYIPTLGSRLLLPFYCLNPQKRKAQGLHEKPLPGLGHRMPPQRTARARVQGGSSGKSEQVLAGPGGTGRAS